MATGSVPDALREMAIRFECGDWISDLNIKVQRKEEIIGEMVRFFQNTPVNKHRLLAQNRVGFNVALAAAIQARPSEGDADLILEIDPLKVTRGVAQRTLFSTIEKLERKKRIPGDKTVRFADWLGRLQNVHEADRASLDALIRRLR
jgi:hypothetical protein